MSETFMLSRTKCGVSLPLSCIPVGHLYLGTKGFVVRVVWNLLELGSEPSTSREVMLKVGICWSRSGIALKSILEDAFVVACEKSFKLCL